MCFHIHCQIVVWMSSMVYLPPHPKNSWGCPPSHNTKYYWLSFSFSFCWAKKLGPFFILHFQITSDADLLKIVFTIYLFSDLKDESRVGYKETLSFREPQKEKLVQLGMVQKEGGLGWFGDWRKWQLETKNWQAQAQSWSQQKYYWGPPKSFNHISLTYAHFLCTSAFYRASLPKRTVCCSSSDGYSGQSPVSSPCSLPWGKGWSMIPWQWGGGELLVQQKHNV